jgi:hypothetical protein
MSRIRYIAGGTLPELIKETDQASCAPSSSRLQAYERPGHLLTKLIIPVETWNDWFLDQWDLSYPNSKSLVYDSELLTSRNYLNLELVLWD